MAKTAVMKVWDVDAGLAVHIKAPNGRYIVIDLGSSNEVSPLKALEGKDVGYMVITHPHLDHIRDIENINLADPKILWWCKSFTRRNLLKEDEDNAEDEYSIKIRKYCDLIGKHKCNTDDVIIKWANENSVTFDGLSVRVFQHIPQVADTNNMNNFSALVVLQLGTIKIIVCGDNEEESIKNLMEWNDFKEAVKFARVLVAPHHGHTSGYYEDFVNIVHPQLTVISDVTKSEASAIEKYEQKSMGCHVIDYEEEKKCLTTSNDGHVEIKFGYNYTRKDGFFEVRTLKDNKG